jgi:phage shock protein E
VIYLYCGSGRRAGIAQESLQASGYTNVTNIGGLDEAMAVSANTGPDPQSTD